MAKIQFALSSQQMASGGGTNQRSAPGVQAPGQIKAPGFEAPQANAGLLPSNFESTPVLNPQVAQRGMSLMVNAALDYRDRQDTLDAEDALLRARERSRALLNSPDDLGDGVFGFERLTGKEAVDKSGEYQKRIAGAYDEIAEGLGGNAKAKYLAAAGPHKFADLDKVARHTVKAQDEYQEDVVYRAGQAFKSDFELDPIKAMESGALNRLLALQPDAKKKGKVLEDVFSFAMDKFIAEDYQSGYQTAQGFLNRYGSLATPDARLKAQEKIASANKAAISLQRKFAEDNKGAMQKNFMLSAPPVVAQAMEQLDGAAVSAIVTAGSDFHKDTNYSKYLTDVAVPLITGAMWQQARTQNVPVEVLRERYMKTRDNAEKAGAPFDPLVDNGVMRDLEEIGKFQQEQKRKREQDGERFLAENAKIDPTTGEPVYPLDQLPKGFEINPETKLKLASQNAKIGKKIEDERTKDQYTEQYSAWVGMAYAGQIVPGSEKEAEFNKAQFDPRTRLTPEHQSRIREIAKRDITKDNTQLTAARKAIDGLAQNGYFEPGVATKSGKKPYKETQLTAATWSAYAQWMRRAEELIAEGNKNVVGTIEAELAQSVKERTFFSGAPEKFGAPPAAPQAAPRQPKVTTPPPQQAPVAPGEAATPTPSQPQQDAPSPAPVNIKTFKPEFQRLDPAVQKRLNEGEGMDIQIQLQNDAYSWAKFQSMTPQEQLSRIEKVLGGGKK